MPSCGLRSSGRELTVKFTCSRCGHIEYLPYDSVMDYQACYLHQSNLPSGWGNLDYDRILCKDCVDKLKRSWRGTKWKALSYSER